MAALFRLGKLRVTPEATTLLLKFDVSPAALIGRHASGDWGDLDRHDRAVNDRALKEGLQLMSFYLQLNIPREAAAGLSLRTVDELMRAGAPVDMREMLRHEKDEDRWVRA